MEPALGSGEFREKSSYKPRFFARQRFWSPPGNRDLRAWRSCLGPKKGPAKGAGKIYAMLNVKPEEQLSNPGFPTAASDELSAACQRVQQAVEYVGQMLADQGLVEDLAVMFQADPLTAETAFRDEVCGMCRTIWARLLKASTIMGRVWKFKGSTTEKSRLRPDRR